MAVEKLRATGLLKIILNNALFNQKPKFLAKRAQFSRAEIWHDSAELTKFREGLAVLALLSGRNKA